MLLTGWLVVALLGIALTEAMTQRVSGMDDYCPLVLALGAGVGLCLSGLCYFVHLLIFPNSPQACIALELVLFLGLMSIHLRGRNRWHPAFGSALKENKGRYIA